MTRHTTALARWCATHPWRAVACWLVLVVAAVAVGALVPSKDVNDADLRVGEAGRAQTLVERHGLAAAPTEQVLVQSRSGALDRSEASAAARALRTRLADLSVVTRVERPVLSPGGGALLVTAELTSADVDVEPLQAVTRDVQRDHAGLRVRESGEASLNPAINDHVGATLQQAERISLPVTLVILLLAFGALVAAGIPVLLAMAGVLATIGLYAPLSHLVPATPTVSNMVLLIGMAVGVDYALFYLKRHREERAEGAGPVDAVRVAAETSGHAVVVSGCAVVVAMAGLYLVGDPTFSSLATGAIVVVLVSVLGSLTVVPALLALLGDRVDKGRLPFVGRLRRTGRSPVSARVLGPVLRHPVAALVVASLALAALALPAFGMRMHEGNLDTLPQSIPEVSTMKAVAREFPTQGESVDVVAEADRGDLPGVVRRLERLRDAALAGGGYADGATPQVRTGDGAALLSLPTRYPEGSGANERVLQETRALAPTYLGGLPRSSWAVGGSVADEVDDAAHQSRALPWMVGAVLLLTLVMMGVTFRSVGIAVITTVLNLASVGAAFGVLVLVFQHSWADGLLGTPAPGFVVDWIPLFLFVVLVGLSMDYHVFVLSRVREALRQGMPPRVAVQDALVGTAGTVTSAAAVMVAVFAVFAGLDMVEMKQIGIGLAVAVLVDATLVRVVLLPSVLSLLGRVAWWPGAPAEPVLEPVVEPVSEPALSR